MQRIAYGQCKQHQQQGVVGVRGWAGVCVGGVNAKSEICTPLLTCTDIENGGVELRKRVIQKREAESLVTSTLRRKMKVRIRHYRQYEHVGQQKESQSSCEQGPIAFVETNVDASPLFLPHGRLL